jgi:hypothetical protein
MATVHPFAWSRWVKTNPTRWAFQEVRQLVNHDDDGNAGQETGHDGRRQEVGDPPEPENADEHHHEPDHHRQDRHQLDVVVGTRQSEGGHPGGEQRCDGRVGPDRHLGIGAEEGEDHGSRHEGVEAGDGGHPGQSGGGKLLRHGDDQEHEPRQKVRAGPRPLIAVE